MVEIKATPIKVNVSNFKTNFNDNKVGTIQSVLSGIAAGLIDIPKGAFSLGASLMDMGFGTDNAAQVESFFDDLTTFDEKAEATTAGKITRIVTNLGIPGTAAFRLGSKLTKQAIEAKKAGTYYKITKDADDKLQKTLTTKGRFVTTLGGAGGVGASDAIFVGDPERVGTIGDAFNIGPTQLAENDENNAAREVMNRLKFGVDSAFLGGIIAGTGTAMKMAVQRSNKLNKNNDAIDKILEYITPQGAKTRDFFETERVSIGRRSARLNKAQVLHRQLDKSIDALYPLLGRIGSTSVQKEREGVVKIINDALTSSVEGPKVELIKRTNPETKRTELVGGKFSLGDMDPSALKKVKDIVGVNGKKIDYNRVVELLTDSRIILNDMFTDVGNNIIRAGKKTDEATTDTIEKFFRFRDAFEAKSIDYINNTYKIFRNSDTETLASFKPGAESVENAKEMFIELSRRRNAVDKNVKVLTDQQAEYAVDRLLSQSKKYNILAEGEVVPLLKDETGFLKDVALKDFDKPLLPLNKVVKTEIKTGTGQKLTPKRVIEELFGKVEDPSATILSSMNSLAVIRGKHEFYGDLYDRMIGKQFFATRAEAASVFGDRNVLNNPIKMEATDRGRSLFTEAINPLNGLYTSKGNQEALEGINRSLFSWTENNNVLSNFYNNFILFPKATSQLAKTVLSPVTHMRNIISAAAFAGANGLVPLVDQQALKEAYGAFAQVGSKGSKDYNKRYQELLELGVVNSNARQGDLTAILADTSETSFSRAMQSMMKKLGKAKDFATDLYTAEDDFWKMYTFAAERNRIKNALKNSGIDGTAFAASERNDLGRAFASYNSYLDEAAARIVRNNVPNYDYVSAGIKDLRRAPIGNFVSFPAEIIRTSVNIMKKGLDEFNYVAPNGTKPFKTIGMTRLAGYGLTATVIPYGLVEGFKAAYNVTNEEMSALRRFVPEWSKNSTLIPIKGDDGKFKYVDFSHANAYDTMVRPIQTIFNAIADGRTDTDTVMEDVLQGVVESTNELGKPFISESIWTESISDIFIRKGRTRDGRRLYTEQTPFGDRFERALLHMVESQLPGSFGFGLREGQIDRLIDAVAQNPNRYGQTFELKNEVLGFAGLRAVEIDPVRSMKFKIADYTRGVSNSRREFTSPLLRGGVVTPEQIVDRYQIANSELYKVQKRIYDDYYGARVLGASESSVDAEFADRVSNVALGNIKAGRFKPFIPSENIIASFAENARKLGQTNPYSIAEPTINRIARGYSGMSLLLDAFPVTPNPFSTAPITLPTAGMQSNLPNLGLTTSVPTQPTAVGNTTAKGQQVFGPLDTVFGS
tara:strand:+ start:1087 stop:5055 length:3969 start_codon:yes stop_codon:yes gene_type:complete